MKMYCIFAKTSIDAMSGNRGKLAAQAGHAFLHSYWDSETRFPTPKYPTVWMGEIIKDIEPAPCELYKDSGKAKKVTLVVPTVDDLLVLESAYKSKVGVSLVTDAGLTCFKEPTITCLGIGPLYDEQIGDDLKALKVLI